MLSVIKDDSETMIYYYENHGMRKLLPEFLILILSRGRLYNNINHPSLIEFDDINNLVHEM